MESASWRQASWHVEELRVLAALDVAGGHEIRRLDEPDVRAQRAFSPDGRLLAFAGGGHVRVVEVFSGRVVANLAEDSPAEHVFVGDGARHVALSRSSTALLIDLATGRRMPVLAQGSAIAWIALSADGTRATAPLLAGAVRLIGGYVDEPSVRHGLAHRSRVQRQRGR